jgi:hypothetical protein
VCALGASYIDLFYSFVDKKKLIFNYSIQCFSTYFGRDTLRTFEIFRVTPEVARVGAVLDVELPGVLFSAEQFGILEFSSILFGCSE